MRKRFSLPLLAAATLVLSACSSKNVDHRTPIQDF